MKSAAFAAEIGYFIKLASNHSATLSSKNHEIISNFEDWSLALVAYNNLSVLLTCTSSSIHPSYS